MNIAIKDTSLEDIVRRIEAGEHVTLTRDGKPFAKVEPTLAEAAPVKKSILGAMRGQIWMADDFDELGPEWDEYTK
ncbi:type II toxin-antitoxin system prevent-host-death family antitoxin [Rhizobium sp. TH2]|uniref:type II toxin-antitoxin system Phd/YefM family antitoxin n=1 Tax=Rhizobium sp. TH2 TaxID=2775403 RepID=UPI002157AC34|nr:type II toxin-antitoxin system prevent-host-death family antitoxin [Rhizobium sp. TH2]UVC08801.1 type II toxin-antitoxin system prevent-host-death family antitoxin [Rhizobium sp. TH2]